MSNTIEKIKEVIYVLSKEQMSPRQLELAIRLLTKTVKEIDDKQIKLTDDLKSGLSDLLTTISVKDKEYIDSEFVSIKEQTQSVLDQSIDILKQVKSIKIKDGKDADEDKIIKKVLELIKIPEKVIIKNNVIDDNLIIDKILKIIKIPKEYILSGENIVNEINKLPVNEENQIDYSHIKNVPESEIRGVGSFGIREAPKDGGIYGRINRAWTNLVDIFASITEPLSLHLNGDNSPTANIDFNNFGIDNLSHIKLQEDYSPSGDETTGTIYWDEENKTYSGVLEGGVIGQFFQEQHIYGKNTSGAIIQNGKAVSITNVGGSFTTFAKTDVTDATSAKAFAGIATQDIGINEFGYITVAGIVRELNTNSFTEGATLYVSCVTAGDLTTSLPTPECYVCRVGTVEYKHLNQGRIRVLPITYPKLEDLSGVDGTPLTTTGQFPVWNQDNGYFDFDRFLDIANGATGFATRDTTTISFNSGTLTFSITPTSTSFDYYRNYKKITKIGAQTVTISDVTGLYFIYFDENDDLIASTTPWDFTNGKVFVALLKWNTTINKYILEDERHGLSMSWATHQYLHNTIGTRYQSGLAGTFGDTTFSVDSGTIFDEDLKYDITTQTYARVFYKNGSNIFEWTDPQTNYMYVSGGNTYYNDGNTLTAVPANLYSAVWIFATNAIDYPIISVIGQRYDTTLAEARNNNKYESLLLSDLPFKEYKLLYRVILRNDATPYEETQDLRSISNVPAGTYVATAHSTLTNLAWLLSGHTGTANKLPAFDANGNATEIDVPSGVKAITCTINGMGVPIEAGDIGYVSVPYSGVVSSWRILSDVNTTAVVDVWLDTYANFPPLVADSIAGTEKPSLTTTNKNEDTSLTTWDTTVTEGDIIAFKVDSNDLATLLVIQLILE